MDLVKVRSSKGKELLDSIRLTRAPMLAIARVAVCHRLGFIPKESALSIGYGSSQTYSNGCMVLTNPVLLQPLRHWSRNTT